MAASEQDLTQRLNEIWNRAVQSTNRAAESEVLKSVYTATLNEMFGSIRRNWEPKTFEQLQLRIQRAQFSFENFCQQVQTHGAHVSTET